jgi:hypothetical protein
MRYLFIVLFGALLGGPLGFVLAVFLCYFLTSNRGTVRSRESNSKSHKDKRLSWEAYEKRKPPYETLIDLGK